MPTYDWIVLITLGLDRWSEPRRPRTAFEIERAEAHHAYEVYLANRRQARRRAALARFGTALKAMLRPRRPPFARPRKPASRV